MQSAGVFDRWNPGAACCTTHREGACSSRSNIFTQHIHINRTNSSSSCKLFYLHQTQTPNTRQTNNQISKSLQRLLVNLLVTFPKASALLRHATHTNSSGSYKTETVTIPVIPHVTLCNHNLFNQQPKKSKGNKPEVYSYNQTL